jgi:Cu/Ag efflux pump CusA
MLNKIISWSLKNKYLVLILAGAVSVLGVWSLSTMKVDILPDINKPTETVLAQAPGMATEDVGRLI